MPLSWNEIRDRAIAFSKEWEDAESEQAESQSFWNGFFDVFGITRKRVASFEKQVDLTKAGHKLKGGRIDAFWKGVLLIEHKSAGRDLDKAFGQAIDYFDGLAERDLPNFILVSDFQRFRLYDLEKDEHWEFKLKDLHKNIKRFGFVAGYAPQEIKPQDPVNIKAAEQMGRLHDQLKASGYVGHALEVLLVRLVFCLFADDTGIFNKQSFRDWLEARTAEDGSDLGPQLTLLFQVLNTDRPKRQKNLDEQLAEFPWVNGKLFEETLQVASFDSKMRSTLLDSSKLNWGAVSPAVFGALFQSIMDEKARRNLGAHYTSEENILKLIKPLFLDDLWAEFEKVKGNKNRLFEFHKKLRSLVFIDPACGCGNFLVITYRELRLLELEVLRAVHSGPGSRFLNIHQELTLDVDQFYGIEIEEFPAQIAQVALWLIDHQMNLKVSEEFGMYFARIPLKTSPHIANANALRIDWQSVVPATNVSFVMGNPPFVGKKEQSEVQKTDVAPIFGRLEGGGVLDYVSAWYIKAADYISGTSIRCAFVSTSSITQGEQVAVLWTWLIAHGIRIHFAHRTFQWSNEAKGQAAVHCVIVGFGAIDVDRKLIYDYEQVDGDAHVLVASRINPYLIDAPDVLLTQRSRPICNVPELSYGSFALDDGHFTLSLDEREKLLHEEPAAARFLRPFVGGQEMLHGEKRWCLWLIDADPAELRSMPAVMRRVDAVRQWRQSSKRKATKELSATPTRFAEIRQPVTSYVAIPTVSSERRAYIPIAFFTSDIVASNQIYVLADAELVHFGVLSSRMHMAWIRHTCGRLESRYRYSSSIVYNNFPWPKLDDSKVRGLIANAAEHVLQVRNGYPSSSLADLYDPLSSPKNLVKAHSALDRAVDAAYGNRSHSSDAERVAYLFELYQKFTSLLPTESKAKKKPRAAKST